MEGQPRHPDIRRCIACKRLHKRSAITALRTLLACFPPGRFAAILSRRLQVPFRGAKRRSQFPIMLIIRDWDCVGAFQHTVKGLPRADRIQHGVHLLLGEIARPMIARCLLVGIAHIGAVGRFKNGRF